MNSTSLANLIDFGASHELESLLVIRHGTIVAEAHYAPFRLGVTRDQLVDQVSHRHADRNYS